MLQRPRRYQVRSVVRRRCQFAAARLGVGGLERALILLRLLVGLLERIEENERLLFGFADLALLIRLLSSLKSPLLLLDAVVDVVVRGLTVGAIGSRRIDVPVPILLFIGEVQLSDFDGVLLFNLLGCLTDFVILLFHLCCVLLSSFLQAYWTEVAGQLQPLAFLELLGLAFRDLKMVLEVLLLDLARLNLALEHMESLRRLHESAGSGAQVQLVLLDFLRSIHVLVLVAEIVHRPVGLVLIGELRPVAQAVGKSLVDRVVAFGPLARRLLDRY